MKNHYNEKHFNLINAVEGIVGGHRAMADIKAGRLGASDYAANFDDMLPAYTRQEALVESNRCYFCHDAPCMEA